MEQHGHFGSRPNRLLATRRGRTSQSLEKLTVQLKPSYRQQGPWHNTQTVITPRKPRLRTLQVPLAATQEEWRADVFLYNLGTSPHPSKEAFDFGTRKVGLPGSGLPIVGLRRYMRLSS